MGRGIITGGIIALVAMGVSACSSQPSTNKAADGETDRYARQQQTIEYVRSLPTLYPKTKCQEYNDWYSCKLISGYYGINGMPYDPIVAVKNNKVWATYINFSTGSMSSLTAGDPNKVIFDIASGAGIIKDELSAAQLVGEAEKFYEESGSIRPQKLYIGSGSGSGVSKTVVFTSKKVVRGPEVEVVFQCITDIKANAFDDNCMVTIGRRT